MIMAALVRSLPAAALGSSRVITHLRARRTASPPRYEPESYTGDSAGHTGPVRSDVTLITRRPKLGRGASGSHKGVDAGAIGMWRIPPDPSRIHASATVHAGTTVQAGTTVGAGAA